MGNFSSTSAVNVQLARFVNTDGSWRGTYGDYSGGVRPVITIEK